MTTTKTDERKLDEWIYANVPGLKTCQCVGGIKPKWPVEKYKIILEIANGVGAKWSEIEPDIQCDHAPHFTTDSAASFALLRKCAEKVTVEVAVPGGVAMVWAKQIGGVSVESETLELAVARFAKKLWSK